MTKRTLTDADILAQGRTALARERKDRKAGLRATAVWYDYANGHVMMALSNNRLFGVAAQDIPALRNATAAQLRTVELSPGGDGLHWETLDVDLSVPGLLLETLGRSEIVRAWAQMAGRVKNPARAKASRANGAKGGRPRKTRAA
jgi:hypothetical protein